MKSIDEKVLEAFYEIISESKQEMYDLIAADRTRYITVAMENVQKTHNASAVIRSCDCFGVQDLHLIEPNNKYEAQRDISRGATKWIDVHTYDDSSDAAQRCVKKLREDGYKLVATSPYAAKTIFDISLDRPIALLFGTERYGISEDVMNEADEHVKIPMYGFTESFNVSVSVAIMLNTLRQRLEKSSLNWKLSEEEQRSLKIDWCTKIVNEGVRVESEIRRRILEKE